MFKYLLNSRHYKDPKSLFDAPIVRFCPDEFSHTKYNIQNLAARNQILIIWTDCDREGEHIGYEILEVVLERNPNIQVYRAIFSEITKTSVEKALLELRPLDINQSNAVDVRMELDLRLGCAFTRFLTINMKKMFRGSFDKFTISFGPCQFPTLGFVVERYKECERFTREQYWSINVRVGKTDFSWARGRIFSPTFVNAIYRQIHQKL